MTHDQSIDVAGSEGGPGVRISQSQTGLSRVQFGSARHLLAASASAAPVEGGPSTRVHTGAMRFTNGDAEATTSDLARHVQTYDGVPGGSILATLQRMGPAMTVEMEPGNPSSRTDVRIALREGLLMRNAAGHLEEVAGAKLGRPGNAASGASSQGSEAAPADPGAAAFDAQADERWAAEIAPMPQHAYDSAQARAVAFVANGSGTLDSMANALARDAAMEPARARQTIENGIRLHQQAAEKALAPLGLTGDRLQAFYADARQRGGILQDAIQKLAMQRDPSGLVNMARDWVERNPGPEVAELKAAGFEVARDPKAGGFLARKPGGGWHPVASILKGTR